jgi:membrane protein insertase Oxa1/YidC/SpoIIIJ
MIQNPTTVSKKNNNNLFKIVQQILIENKQEIQENKKEIKKNLGI